MIPTPTGATTLFLCFSAIVQFPLPCQTGEPKRQTLNVKEKHRFKGGVTLKNFVFSPDGNLLAGKDREAIVVWEVSSGREKARIESREYLAPLAFSSDSRLITWTVGSVIEGKTMRSWDIEKNQEGPVLRLGPGAAFLTFFPDGKHFLVRMRKAIVLEKRDAKTGLRIGEPYELGNDSPYKAFSSQDARLLAALNFERGIQIWRIDTQELLATLKGHTGNIQEVCFSVCGKRVASACWDKTVRIWDTKTGDTLHKFSSRDVPVTVDFSPDGKWLAIGYIATTSRISIFDAKDGEELLSWQPERANSLSLAFSPDGKLLACTGGNSFQVFEITVQKGPPVEKKKE